MTPIERNACYNARRVIRASDPVKFAKKHGFDRDLLIMKLVDVLPELLKTECIATAEKKAIERIHQLMVIVPDDRSDVQV